jgi:hypothetical protein
VGRYRFHILLLLALVTVAIASRWSGYQTFRVENYHADEFRSRFPALNCETLTETNSLRFKGGPEILEELRRLDQPDEFGLVGWFAVFESPSIVDDMSEGRPVFPLGTSPGYREGLLDAALSTTPHGDRFGWAAYKRNGGTRLNLVYETLEAQARLRDGRFSVRFRVGNEWQDWRSKEVKETEGWAYRLGDGNVLGPEARRLLGPGHDLGNYSVWCLIEWGGRFPDYSTE